MADDNKPKPLGYGAHINVIEFKHPRDVYELWDHVREHHWYMLGAKTLSALKTFRMAYWASLNHHGIELPSGEPNFNDFSNWVAARYGEPNSTGGWQHFLASDHTDEEGYEAFFKLLDEFRTRTLVEVATSHVDLVKWPTRRVTVLAGGEEREHVIHPITKVRLLSYVPEDAFWAELTRTEGEPEVEWLGGSERAFKWCRDQLGVDLKGSPSPVQTNHPNEP